MLPGVEVVGVAYAGEEALALCRKEEPDVVLMDISMPKMDGISATREIKALLPRTAGYPSTCSRRKEAPGEPRSNAGER
ncbi:MAG TPA: response regulator [Rubrobacter sp.]|jgi:YesN/AraC family two-component response regulator|nr:response regulator [Rubrobacter sp.]